MLFKGFSKGNKTTFGYELKAVGSNRKAAQYAGINVGKNMILAMLINKKGIKLKGMWRTIFVITIAVPQFVSLMLMSKMLGETGAINNR